MPLVAVLERSAPLQDIDLVTDLLRELVPTFKPTVAYAVQEAERVSSGTYNGH
jgi:hypothetical protein